MSGGGPPAGPRLRAAAPFAAVLAAGALAHLPALLNGFVWDDLTFVLRNPVLADPENAPLLLARPETWGTGTLTPYYRPLTMLAFLLDRQLWGDAPLGYHATSVLLHLGVCALLLAVLRRLLAPGAALAGALLFAVHPATAEPVAYVSARADLLCALFVLASCIAWMRHVEGGERRALTLSALAYGAALLAKITAGLFPGVFFLHGWLFHRRRPRAREVLPFAGVALAYLAARAVVLEMDAWPSAPLLTRVATAGPLLVRYALMALSPARLSVFHDLEPRASLDGPAIEAWAAVAACVAVAVAAAPRAPRAALALAWFVAGVFPVCGIVTTLHPALAADRYLYLPLAGVALAAGAGIQRLSAAPLSAGWRRVAPVAGGVALLALAGTTVWRDRFWRDPVTLWERAAQQAPCNEYALVGLGQAYSFAGRSADARRTLLHCLEHNEANAEVHLNLANVALLDGDVEVARHHVQRTLALDPGFPAAYRFLGIVEFQRGDEAAALRAAQRALELNAFDEVARDLVARLHGEQPAGGDGEGVPE